jgi:hypothetical protein
LSIPLISPIHAHQQNARTICSKQRADGIEFRREDLENDKREGKLTEGSADISTFKGSLRSADFDESVIDYWYGFLEGEGVGLTLPLSKPQSGHDAIVNGDDPQDEAVAHELDP